MFVICRSSLQPGIRDDGGRLGRSEVNHVQALAAPVFPGYVSSVHHDIVSPHLHHAYSHHRRLAVMSALCDALPRLWALNPGIQEHCAHRTEEKFVPNYWISFVLLSMGHMMSFIAPIEDEIDTGVTNKQRSLVSLTAVILAQYVKREHALCITDMHCTGAYKILQYPLHFAPLIFWIVIPAAVGWAVLDLAVMLRLWIKKGGFTTRRGLVVTGVYGGLTLFLGAATTVNAMTWQGLTEAFNLTPKGVLSVLVYVLTFPLVVMKAVTWIINWYSGHSVIEKTEEGLGEGKLEKNSADGIGDGSNELYTGDDKKKALSDA